MSSILPPFDRVPKLPADVISKVKQNVDISIDALVSDSTRFIKSVTKLPKDCNCDDPRIQRVKIQISKIQSQLNAVQSGLSGIQSTVDNIKKLYDTAAIARNALYAAALLNPQTAGAIVQQQALLLQDAILVNTVQSLQSMTSIPTDAISKMATIVPALLQSMQTVSLACSGDIDQLSVDELILNETNKNPESEIVTKVNDPADSIVKDSLNDWNSKLDSDFYNDANVSESDLIDRAAVIQEYSEQIQTIDDSITDSIEISKKLAESILEAPAKIFKGNGIPNDDQGKIGDYYIDLDTNIVYGPKLQLNSWN